MFKIIEDLVQGSEEWHQRRNSGIGGTDAPVIMGENPWKSSKYLLEEKLGLRKRFEGNEHTRRGITLEPLARSAYEKITKIKLEPAVLQSNKLNWQFASTDGINVQKKKIIEIKCGIKAYEYTAKNNITPPYYYGQIQHILSVSGYKSLDFFCWLPDCDPVLVNIERNEEYITRLIKEEFKFYQLMQNKKLDSSEPEKSETSYSQQQTTYNFQYNYSLLNQTVISLSLSSPDRKGVEINLKNTEEKKSEILSSKLNNISLNKNLPKIFLEGATYSGDRKDDLMHGFGTLTSKDAGYIYTGDFKNGLMHGFGTFITREGKVYTGDWVQELFGDEGITGWSLKSAVWTDYEGNKYSGDLFTKDFVEFAFHGYGIYQWYEGAKYEGFFKDGLRDGEGTFISVDGDKYSGQWKQGVLEKDLLEYVKFHTQDIHEYYEDFIDLTADAIAFNEKWAGYIPHQAFNPNLDSQSPIFMSWLKSLRNLVDKLDTSIAIYDDVRDHCLTLEIEVDFYCCYEESYLDDINERMIASVEYIQDLRNELMDAYEDFSNSLEVFEHVY